ncbi:hypothetical protein BJF90_38695 [Pseudonocardia sp. CNS-004]|nr:hypothetical protein BJF90_38695 [Pseudonocardia sp. CNS-004]
MAFHSAVAAAVHNIFLASVIDNVFTLMHRLKAAGIGEARDAMQRGSRDHTTIAAAILRGDPDGAEEAMRCHIDNSVEDYRRTVRERAVQPRLARSRLTPSQPRHRAACAGATSRSHPVGLVGGVPRAPNRFHLFSEVKKKYGAEAAGLVRRRTGPVPRQLD